MSVVARPHTSEVPRTTPAGRRTAQRSGKPAPPPRRKSRLLLLLAAAAVIVAVGVGLALRRGGDTLRADGTLVLYEVKPTDLEVTVTERGNLESQFDVQVLCEVDDVSGDGINGTPIVWIVENGSSVKEGELLVELDSTPLRDRLDEQVLDAQAANANHIQAKVAYENQVTQNETNLAEAELAVELAKLAVKQFEDEEGGTFQIELQEIELLVQEAEAGQLIEKTNLEGTEQLYKLGYRSSGELAQARLNALKAERNLATTLSKRRELVEYQYKKRKMELEGALASAEREREQVGRNNEAILAQAKAKMDAAAEALEKEEELLARYTDQVEKCKIYAPQDGMVAYATGNRWNREEIRAGAPVRPRQAILSLPNLQRMQVKTAVHESVLDRIKKGLNASIRVDAFPDRQYNGTVQSVAVLPDQGGWMSSDTKVYSTVVTIDQEVEQLKPGMTAVVQIHVDHLRDVLAIPVQSIVQIGNSTWVYVQEKGHPARRAVELGVTNDRFVQIRNGLSFGDQVVLNPTAIADSTQTKRDLGMEQEKSAEPADDQAEPIEETPAPADGLS